MAEVVRWWKLTNDGRVLTRDEHLAECQRIGQSVLVVGFKWETDDLCYREHVKTYAPYVPHPTLLPDGSGFIVTEPRELAGDARVVVYNADGSERFRLAPTLPPGMFPSYMADSKLVTHERSIVQDGYAAMFEDQGGARIVEFDQNTGQYTGVFRSIRY